MPIEKLANQQLLSMLSPEITFKKSLDDEVRIPCPDTNDLESDACRIFDRRNASQYKRLALNAQRGLPLENDGSGNHIFFRSLLGRNLAAC